MLALPAGDPNGGDGPVDPQSTYAAVNLRPRRENRSLRGVSRSRGVVHGPPYRESCSVRCSLMEGGGGAALGLSARACFNFSPSLPSLSPRLTLSKPPTSDHPASDSDSSDSPSGNRMKHLPFTQTVWCMR